MEDGRSSPLDLPCGTGLAAVYRSGFRMISGMVNPLYQAGLPGMPRAFPRWELLAEGSILIWHTRSRLTRLRDYEYNKHRYGSRSTGSSRELG